jgi:hypothetical protein
LLGAPQVRKQLQRPQTLVYLARKNEAVDKIAKLGSSRTTVLTGVFLQEFYESSILKALANTTKAAKLSQETLPSKESITESPEVMEIYSD